MEIKDENYITIQGWMVNKLKLKGNELMLYAIIYGFSQAENQSYNGNLQYLASWTNSTKQGVIKALKSLQEKNLLSKNENFINGIKFCEYKSLIPLNKVEYPIKQSLTEGIKQSLPNNTINNNNIYNKKEKEDGIDAILNTQPNELIVNLKEFLKMRKAIKKPMTTLAFKMLVNKLNKLSQDIDIQNKILEQSILHCWQDVYKLKDCDVSRETIKQNYKNRDYSGQDLNKLFDDLSEVEL